ncbi:GNAT family N-acetyltransferase [Bacterioplanes sanyensis]|uniref:GNAT family N-acetyltransferase n=1 Tax=Bacterioplanes sanyensis TaxID=1249553 RepID=A0A222FIL0_9GAMM|nr:GNAT family N-acetyltransferase [Bacterioplanes sanyensis]ASP38436.1 GNAT family N-acetyltransferase [Bacterioplanes sanyensis]
MNITVDKLNDDGIVKLLQEHLQDMHAQSPAESVHALPLQALKAADLTFWSARELGQAIGCIALKQLSSTAGEIKSMRTREAARGRGVAGALLQTLLHEANQRGYQTLWLETGSMAFFRPARRLYKKYGFYECGPFADYKEDPHSVFMRYDIRAKR